MPSPSDQPNSDDILVCVEGVGKKFCRDLKKSLWYGMKDIGAELLPGSRDLERHATLRPGEFWAVDDVSFELRRGECLGLIGRNGAGKTTLLKMLNGLIKPDKGRIEIRGRVGALIALGAGFNPILTGRENIYVNGSVLGLRKREVDSKLEEIVEFAELAEFIDSPVQTYSSGMAVRLGFSIAAALEPDVLFVDEVLAVGDSAFRVKCYNKIMGLRERMATIFVSHSMPQVAKLSTIGLVLKPRECAPAVQSVTDAILTYFESVSTASIFLEGCHSASLKTIGIEQGDMVSSVASPWPTLPHNVGELKGEAPLLLKVSVEPFPVVIPVMAVWSITDIDQRLVAQTISDPVALPAGGERFDLVTQIEALNLNSGRFTLSVHLLASPNGDWGTIVAGLRDILSFSIVRDGFNGSANILYPASSFIDAPRRGPQNEVV